MRGFLLNPFVHGAGSGGGLISATKWRIYITASTSNANTSIQSLIFLDENGLAISFSGATVTSSSEFSATYSDDYAFNTRWGTGGAISTAGVRWAANGSTNPPASGQWLAVEFSTAKTVCAIWLMPHGSTDAPADYAWQYYNGSSWVDVYSTSGDTWTTATWEKVELQSHADPTLTSDADWQLEISANGGESSGIVSLTEIELLDSSMAKFAYSGGTITYSSQLTGYEATKAFDANTSTRWASQNAASDAFPKDIGYGFTAAKAPQFLSLRSSVNADYAAAFNLQYGGAGSWVTLKAFSGLTAGSNLYETYPLYTE